MPDQMMSTGMARPVRQLVKLSPLETVSWTFGEESWVHDRLYRPLRHSRLSCGW